MTTPSPPPGWYPDPHGRVGRSYWTGSEWGDPPKANNRVGYILLGIIAVFVLVGLPISYFSEHDSDKPSEASRNTTTFAPAPTTSREPLGPTMDPEPGKAYKIDDCFLCSERPGTWETKGGKSGNPCRWFVEADLTGNDESIIDSGYTKADIPARVALKIGQYFTSTNCYPWRFIG